MLLNFCSFKKKKKSWSPLQSLPDGIRTVLSWDLESLKTIKHVDTELNSDMEMNHLDPGAHRPRVKPLMGTTHSFGLQTGAPMHRPQTLSSQTGGKYPISHVSFPLYYPNPPMRDCSGSSDFHR